MATKPKALLFLPYLAPYRVDVLNKLGDYYDLTVVFQFDNAPEQNFNQNILRKKLTINYIIHEKGFNIGTRQIRFGIYLLIKRYNPDVIFSNEYGPTSIIISLLVKFRLFNGKHFATTSDNVYMAERVYNIKKIARNFVLNNTSGIVVYNEGIKIWYKNNFPHLSVRICPNIQNPDNLTVGLSFKQSIAEKFKKQFGLENKKIILYIGRLHSVKNVDNLIEAYKKTNTSNTKLVIVGEGEEKESLMLKTKRLGIEDNVLFPGRYDGDELYAWYLLANLFVLPSKHEPFGAVVNEALIFGLPVICSKYAGAHYYIKTGYNGFVIDPMDEINFPEMIENGLKMENSNRKSLMVFSFDESVKEYYNIYNESTN